jgi:hypothetical protein
MIDIDMILRTDEPMEGVVFDVQDHTGGQVPVDRYTWRYD